MKLLLPLTFLFAACNTTTQTKDEYKSFTDSLEKARLIDSMTTAVMHNALFDTAGLYEAPVKVLSAKLFREEYSSYKSISITYKNISTKKIDGIRFRWYGENAFGEPADMGLSLENGFGNGFDDDVLAPGRSRTSTWNILSKDGKKVVLAWPYEVAFSDGTKWESGNK